MSDDIRTKLWQHVLHLLETFNEALIRLISVLPVERATKFQRNFPTPCIITIDPADKIPARGHQTASSNLAGAAVGSEEVKVPRVQRQPDGRSVYLDDQKHVLVRVA